MIGGTRLPPSESNGARGAVDGSWRFRELSGFNASFHGTLSRTVNGVSAGRRIVASSQSASSTIFEDMRYRILRIAESRNSGVFNKQR